MLKEACCLSILAASPLPCQSSPYRTIDLGPVPGAGPLAGVVAEDISSDGTSITGGSWDPYIWNRGTGMRRLPLPAGQVAGLAATVNDAGVVGGYAGLGASPNYRALIWDPSGQVTQLHQTNWVWSFVASINNRSELLMSVALPNGTATGESHAFLRTSSGAFIDLTAGATGGSAIDLNNAGQALFASSAGVQLRDPAGGLQTIPNTFSSSHLSEQGQVLGLANNSAGIWTRGAGWRPIPSGLLRIARPGGINSFGQVGASHSIRTSSSPPRFAYFGHLYTEGLGWVDLASLTDPGEVTRIYQVEGITDRGVIAASAAVGPDNRAVLLEPRHLSTLGRGCPSSSLGVAPKAHIAGDTRAGGRVALLASGAQPGGLLFCLTGPRGASISLPGSCTLHLDPVVSSIVALPVNAAGQASLPAVVPASAGGTSLWFQCGILDRSAPNGLFALSNGVRLDVP